MPKYQALPCAVLSIAVGIGTVANESSSAVVKESSNALVKESSNALVKESSNAVIIHVWPFFSHGVLSCSRWSIFCTVNGFVFWALVTQSTMVERTWALSLLNGDQ